MLEAGNPCGITKDTYKVVVVAPPLADVVFYDSAGCAPFEPRFENISQGQSLEYLWEIYPDTGFTYLNETDEESKEPAFSFYRGGVYKLVMYAYNICDQKDTVVTYLHVYDDPEGEILGLTDMCDTHAEISPLVSYDNYGAPISLFNWTFTGGIPESSGNEIPGTIIYQTSGEYPVNLIMSNQCGSIEIMDTFHVQPAPVVQLQNHVSVCETTELQISGTQVNNAAYFNWHSLGDGLFDDSEALNPVYQVAPADMVRGIVELILTASNPACPPESDTFVLELTPSPEVEAGSNTVICEDGTLDLIEANAAYYSSLIWTTDGDGNFDDPAALQSTYIPGTGDIALGTVALFLEATGLPPCSEPVMDTIILSIQKNPWTFAGEDTIIGEDEPYIAINASATGYDQVEWVSLGDGDFENEHETIVVYHPGTEDILNQGVYLIFKAGSISPCMQENSDTLFIGITTKPKVIAGDNVRICEGGDIIITDASAEEYSEVYWTSDGSGYFLNDQSLSPIYTPSKEDIENREITLTLHARGIAPMENYEVTDNKEILIIHNVSIDIPTLDTACENKAYSIDQSFFQDVNMFTWSSSGTGDFNGTREARPVFTFSEDDRSRDSIFFFVEASSILPCMHVGRDTLLIRMYHEPEPLFDISNPEGCAPLKTEFTNYSAGEDLSYAWDFGIGLESSFEDPGEILFPQGRIADTTYLVTLSAINRCNTVSLSRDIVVKPIPITDFGMNVPWGCSPKEIFFNNVTTGLPDSYHWKWGDGSPDYLQPFPESHVFVTGDYDTTYTLTLIAENECGIDSVQKTVQIFPNTVDAFFETDTLFGCAPLRVAFTNYSRGVLGDEPFLNWSWNFGDGNSITDSIHPVHIFTEPGTYSVTLYVNDSCSHDSFTTDIHVMGTSASEFQTDREYYCQHDTVMYLPVNMDIDQIGNMDWDFGDGNTGTGYRASHVYDSSGVFTVTLAAKDIMNGCTSNFSREVEIIPAPRAAFSIPPNDGCQELYIVFRNESEGGTHFAWDYGNGNKSIAEDGQQLFRDSGIYKISLIALNGLGCRDSVSHLLKVNPKPISSFTTSSDLSCVAPVSVRFTNTTRGADDYLWEFGNGTTSKETNPEHNYDTYGTFPVRLIARNLFACADTSEYIYHVYHNPAANFAVDTSTGCDPLTVQFENLSEYGTEYSWVFDHQGFSGEKNPSFTFQGEGVYSISLVVNGPGGCSDSVMRMEYITTYPSPVADFNYTRINEIDTVQFHNYSSGAQSYLWDFGDGLTSAEESPWHRFAVYGDYQVSLTAINDYDCRNTAYDLIHFEFFKGLYFPNAFAPDNISEAVREFKAVGMGLVSYNLLVYDTWGNLLWQSTKLENGAPAEGWDGTYKGEALGPDVYVWHLKEAIFKDGTSYEGSRYGTVTLIK